MSNTVNLAVAWAKVRRSCTRRPGPGYVVLCVIGYVTAVGTSGCSRHQQVSDLDLPPAHTPMALAAAAVADKLSFKQPLRFVVEAKARKVIILRGRLLRERRTWERVADVLVNTARPVTELLVVRETNAVSVEARAVIAALAAHESPKGRGVFEDAMVEVKVTSTGYVVTITRLPMTWGGDRTVEVDSHFNVRGVIKGM